jgi:hypothetical protein
MTAGLLILIGMTLARVELKRVIIKSEEKEGGRSMILFFLRVKVEKCLIYARKCSKVGGDFVLRRYKVFKSHQEGAGSPGLT